MAVRDVIVHGVGDTPRWPSGFPDATNTGYRHAPGYTGSLTSGAAITPASNQTYTGYDFGVKDIGSTSTPVSNVTFRGCRFKATNPQEKLVGVWGSDITFDYCSFEPGVDTLPVALADSYQYGLMTDGAYNTHVEGLTITHCDFWGFGNAICLFGTSATAPVLMQDTWIHDACPDDTSYHTDGVGIISGVGDASNVTIDHNTIESIGNTNGIAFQYGQYSDFTITNNLIGGWGYAVAVGAQGPGPNLRITFTGNTFSTRLACTFGDLYPTNFWTGNGNYWRNNHWSVPAGAAWGNSADDGKFWTPTGPSVTDYTG